MKYLVIIMLLALSQTNAQGKLVLLFDEDNSKYAIDIAGTTEFASKTLPNNLELDSIKFTIIGWIKTPAVLSGNKVFMGTDSDAGTRGWWIGTAGDEFTFIPNNANGQGRTTSSYNLSTNTWYFFTFVCASTTQTGNYDWYVDGVLVVGQAGAPAFVTQNTNPFFVGQMGYAGFPNYWLGQVGEIQIIRDYNLSQAEITDAFQNGLKSSYSAGTVVAWYKWSGSNDATMLKDYSASANNLTGNNVTKADDQVKVGITYK